MSDAPYRAQSFKSKDEPFWRSIAELNQHPPKLEIEGKSSVRNEHFFLKSSTNKKLLELQQRFQSYERKQKRVFEEWKELANNEFQFKILLIEYNDFVCSNHNKRQLALGKSAEFRMRNAQRNRLNEKMAQQIKLLKKAIHLMRNEITKLSIYPDFLDRIVEMLSYDPKETLTDKERLLNFFFILEEARVTLIQKSNALQTTTQSISFVMQKLMKKVTTSLASLNVKLGEQHLIYDQVHNKTFILNSLCMKIFNEMSDQMASKSHLIHSIHGLITVMQRKSLMPLSVSKSDLFSQLQLIKFEMDKKKEVIEKLRSRNYL